jgi:hypothetical protein
MAEAMVAFTIHVQARFTWPESHLTLGFDDSTVLQGSSGRRCCRQHLVSICVQQSSGSFGTSPLPSWPLPLPVGLQGFSPSTPPGSLFGNHRSATSWTCRRLQRAGRPDCSRSLIPGPPRWASLFRDRWTILPLLGVHSRLCPASDTTDTAACGSPRVLDASTRFQRHPPSWFLTTSAACACASYGSFATQPDKVRCVSTRPTSNTDLPGNAEAPLKQGRPVAVTGLSQQRAHPSKNPTRR